MKRHENPQPDWTDLTPLRCTRCTTIIVWIPGDPRTGAMPRTHAADYGRAIRAHTCPDPENPNP